MNFVMALVLFIVGIVLVIFFAEKLVKATVSTSYGFGVSTFLISVIFIGFDPENLAVGSTGSYENISGIALGSIIGATMVAIALAFGLTALIAPMKFESAPKAILTIPAGAVFLFAFLSIDSTLSRVDGVILLTGYAFSVIFLILAGKRGVDIRSGGEVAETLGKGVYSRNSRKWKAFGLLILSITGIITGSEILVSAAESIIAKIGLSDTVFGMTILALLLSIEELARELPAALKGRAEISFGNVVGSVLAFFLFNAGIIVLVRPVTVEKQVLVFYLPLTLLTTLAVSLFMVLRRVSRLAGAVIVILYVVFFAGAFVGGW